MSTGVIAGLHDCRIDAGEGNPHPPVNMNIKKIRRLMRKYGLRCPIRKANPYRCMAKAIETATVAPNLLNREFESRGPRKVLLTDITYSF